MPKISALPVATPANLTGPAILPTTDKNTLTVGTTYAQLRTALFAQGTGYATTDILALGTTPGTTAAINVDTGVYSDIALNVKSANGTRSVRLIVANNNIAFGDTSGNFFNLMANNINKWTIPPDAAGTATLSSAETTARIVGGSVNGLAIRNSGNGRDNLLVNDAGTLLALSDGTNNTNVGYLAVSGERAAGSSLTPNTVVNSSILSTISAGTSSKVQLTYYDGTIQRSAVEATNVASGFGSLDLMKSGGRVTVGVSAVARLVVAGGGAALATTATDGFLFITSCAGAPTGVPSTIPTGTIPVQYDTTNNKIWFYNGSWRGVVVA